MDLKNKKILIEGIGGIGGIISSRLLAVGYDCTLITGNETITKVIKENGIKELVDEKQVFVFPDHVYTSLEEIDDSQKFDFALLIMKAESVVKAAKETIPHLFAHGYVVTLQNGIVEDSVSAEIGEGRLVSGIIAWNGVMVQPGEYRKTTPGTIFIGELNGEDTSRLQDLDTILTEVCPVVRSANIRGALWTKLAINSTINPMSAVSGQTLGELLQERPTRKLFLKIYQEVVDTATASNIKLEKITTNPYLVYQGEGANFITKAFKDLILRIAARKYKDTKSSTLQDLQRGKKTEIPYLNGYVVEEAKKYGIETPVNEYLIVMIQEIETGTREIKSENIDILVEKFNLA